MRVIIFFANSGLPIREIDRDRVFFRSKFDHASLDGSYKILLHPA
jgi:hypothetical protein